MKAGQSSGPFFCPLNLRKRFWFYDPGYEYGDSYNHRVADMISTNMENASHGTGRRANRLAKGLSSASGAMANGSDTEVYFRKVNKLIYIDDVPHDGKVAGMYRMYPMGKTFKK